MKCSNLIDFGFLKILDAVSTSLLKITVEVARNVDRGCVSKEDLYEDVMFRVHKFLYIRLYLCHHHMVKRCLGHSHHRMQTIETDCQMTHCKLSKHSSKVLFHVLRSQMGTPVIP